MLVELKEGIQYDAKTLPLNRFCEVFGYTKGQIQGKIYARNKGQKPVWTYGVEYLKDPDGSINVILEGYQQWILKDCPQALKDAANESEYGSSGKVNDTTSRLGRIPKRPSNEPRSYVLK